MSTGQVKAASDIFNMSEEDFKNLDINQLNPVSDETPSEEDDEHPDHDAEDNQEEDEEDHSETDETDDEQPEDESESEDENSEEDGEEDSEQSDDESNDDSQKPVVVKDAPAKPKKVDKAKPEAEEDKAVDAESLANFHKVLTAPLKAAGHEFTFDSPEQIRELASKGIDYTRKMQQISHLRGIGEILREHDMLDPEKLAYAIDLANHKPEAIARLIKESGVDTYDLGDEKADSYQAVPVNIDGKSKEVAVREIVESYKDDDNFNAVFAEARTWDNDSQVALVNNPEYLHLLAAHANNGVYKKVMAEVMKERAINGAREPILTHYNRIGQAMYAKPEDGGHAQATQKQAAAPKERVVIKRKPVDEATRRKSLAPTASTKTKGKSLKVTSPVDIYNMSEDEFNNLDPDVLRKFNKV